MLFSVIPVCATFPCDRLLCFVGIGAFGLLAQVLFAIFGRDRCEGAGGVRRTLTVSMGVMFLAVHIFLAPLLLSVRARFPTGPPSFLEPLYPTFPLDRIVEQQDVIIVNPPSPFHAIYVPVMRELNGQPVPRHTRVLAPGYSAMEVYRPDDRTLVIRPDLGFFSWKFDELFRGPQVPMHLGQRVVLTGMSVEVTAMTPDGRPREATFRFDVPLEDASLRWIYWKEDAFLPFELPLIGARVTLPSGI